MNSSCTEQRELWHIDSCEWIKENAAYPVLIGVGLTLFGIEHMCVINKISNNTHILLRKCKKKKLQNDSSNIIHNWGQLNKLFI